MKTPPIITCSEWGARPPKAPPVYVGTPRLGVVHHTAGLGGGDTHSDAVEFAKALQHLHMDVRGWNDSGHNFLVMRSGIILQGRWGSVTAIEQGRMVDSAHCPGENDQPGVEHEEVTGKMTPAQFASSRDLWAWICWHTGIRPTQLFGHQKFYATACPGDLEAQLPELRLAVAHALTAARAELV